MEERRIYTIGHSTRTLDEFLGLLNEFSVSVLADIRNFPGSRRYPHFNSESLAESLKQARIKYFHLKQLGGRRKPLKDSVNTAWRVEAFRGYADYMSTPEFADGIKKLQDLASAEPTAYMCSEAVWWSCHRALVSDHLKVNGWKVMHIMAPGKLSEHPYTSAARIVNGRLSYTAENLFSPPQ
jgi:uncharacterized protein (DUF488 family)